MERFSWSTVVLLLLILRCTAEVGLSVTQGALNVSNGNDLSVLPSSRPFYDLVIAVPVLGPATPAGEAELERARHTYNRYNGTVDAAQTPWGILGPSTPWTYRVVFVVAASAGLANRTGIAAPALADGALPTVGSTGLLDGDVFWVDAQDGWEHLSEKTLALMALSEHFDFRFLAKADADTYPCLRRMLGQVQGTPPARQPWLYAGHLMRCAPIAPAGKKFHDPQFLAATGGVVPCHPMYHAGAMYVLGREVVEHLHRGRDAWQLMANEDAMVGLLLLGVRRHIEDVRGSYRFCECNGERPAQELINDLPHSFYHDCKLDAQMAACEERFGEC